MVAKIDIDALKIYEQMTLKITKKLRTASLNSKFTELTGSYKKAHFRLPCLNSLRRLLIIITHFWCFITTGLCSIVKYNDVVKKRRTPSMKCCKVSRKEQKKTFAVSA